MRVHAFLLAATFLVACGGKSDGFRPPVTATRADASSASNGGGDLDFAKQAGSPPGASPNQVGNATWYGQKFAGRKTASGERFDPRQYTAAHRKLPFGTWVEVRRVETGRVVRVRINDRGPWGHADRIIDLSRRAAEDLDIVRSGVARVELRVVGGP
jgi:rare lipoprotein A